jgi:hypothetical protein
MRTTIIAIVFLLIGAAIGGVLAIGFGAGMGAAGGLVMGAQAGVCLAAKTAVEQGVGDQAALDKVISATIAQIRTKSSAVPLEAGIEWIENAAGCSTMLDQFNTGPKPAAG